LMFSSLRRAYVWQIAFLGLLVLSGFLDPLINIRTGLKSSLITSMFVLNIGVISTMAFVLIYYFIQKKNEVMDLVKVEREKSERLLLNVLPKEIAPALRDGKSAIADKCDCASVLFADLAGFTPLSMLMTPEESVDMLNEIFSYFDILANKYGVEKIRTIGDNYMAVCGVPVRRKDHAQALAEMALEMRDYIDSFPEWAGRKITFRFGIHCGPLVAGVIGRHKFHYDVWGDTVNTASRMESEGVPGRIQITKEMVCQLGDDFIYDPRGIIDVKGKGPMETWFLEGKREAMPEFAG
jgi:adenylate cyclase